MGGYCYSWEHGIPADSIHHILGRVSNSPYNACPLNNSKEHMPEGRRNLPAIHSFESRKKYLNKTKMYLDSIGYIPNQADLEFIETNKKYYEKSVSKGIFYD